MADNKSNNLVISIRLNEEEHAALEKKRAEIHEKVGIWLSPTTLVRSWLSDHIGAATPKRRGRAAK